MSPHTLRPGAAKQPMRPIVTDRAAQPVSQEEILSRLASMTRELAHLHATAVKYPALKKILSDVIAELPADTRLPGIRDLAGRLGISLVTAQRAVAELAEEEVLYSRPRSGNFVRNPGRSASAASSAPGSGATAFSAGAQHPFRATFTFGTDSAAPFQREFWEEIAGRFSARHPNAAPVLRFEGDPAEASRVPDALERYDRNIAASEEKEEILHLADFAGERLPAAPVRGRLLPLYYRTYFLFWNRSLLERHGLPKPAYRTFAGQAEYLRGIAPELERLGLESQPYSIQEPVTLLGGRIAGFIRLLGAGRDDAQLRRELTETMETLLAFCRQLHYSVNGNAHWVQGRHDFVKGRAPFFLGYSVDYWEFSRSKPPFALEAYPTLCCDDTLFLWPRLGTVARRSEHPVESMNFLLFLLGKEVQDRFAATGNFGADDGGGVHPTTAADPAWLAETRRKSSPFQFASREDYYMAINVLGAALWRSLVENLPAAETLEQALQIGGSYLQHRAPRG